MTRIDNPAAAGLFGDPGFPTRRWRRLSILYQPLDRTQNVPNLLWRVLPGLAHSMLLPCQFFSRPRVQNLRGTPALLSTPGSGKKVQ